VDCHAGGTLIRKTSIHSTGAAQVSSFSFGLALQTYYCIRKTVVENQCFVRT
jgi:hypothetical protein